LFRELPELRQRGLVSHHHGLGYYRQDAAPAELVQLAGASARSAER
jgi:hypothetical protein